MSERVEQQAKLRPVIMWTLIACLAVAMAPWLSGGQELIARVLSGGALLVGVLIAWMQPAVRRVARGPLFVSFLALAAFASLSYAWSANRYSSVLWVALWVGAGLMFCLSYIVGGEERGVDRVVGAYLISAGIFSAVALVMFFVGTYNRLTGSFYWPNPAGAYLMPAILIALDRMRTRKNTVLWMVSLVVFLCSLMLSDSRGASIILGVASVTYLLVVAETKKYWTQLVVSIVIALVLAICASWLANIIGHHNGKIVPGSRLAEVVEGQSGSVRQRLQFAESALNIWFAHPVDGTGAGTFASVHPMYQKTVISASTDAHDIYIQVLAELGIIGGVLLASVIFCVLLGALRGLVARPEMLAITLGGIALLLHFGADIDFQYPSLIFLAACLFGLVWRGWRQDWAKMSWVAPVAAVLVMVPVASAYTANAYALKGMAAQSSGDSMTAAAEYQVAHKGLTYDPAYINAEGINVYALASVHGNDSASAAAFALNLAHQAEKQDPYDGQNYQLQGRILALEGKVGPAEAAFKRALQLDPNDQPIYSLDLATVEYNSGDYNAAKATAELMLAKYPQRVIDNRLADATIVPTIANLYALIGDADLKQGQIGDAGNQAKAALRVDPTSLDGRALRNQVKKRSQAASS